MVRVAPLYMLNHEKVNKWMPFSGPNVNHDKFAGADLPGKQQIGPCAALGAFASARRNIARPHARLGQKTASVGQTGR